MATVKRGIQREQAAHFGLYRTSAGGDESIIVRRKVGEPTDFMHATSRKVKRQREYLTLASQHYAHLTPSQKAITRHQIEEVEFIPSHGKTDTKILLGRQLFIAKEMRSLETTQKQLVLPYELCIILADENLNPLEGELWLFCTVSGEWFHLPKDEIAGGNWLFSQVPPGYAPYRVYGEAEGYFDPELPEHQAMSEDEIRAYRYHKLLLLVESEIIYPNGEGDLSELKTTNELHWVMVLSEDTILYPPDETYPWGHFEGNYVFKTWYPWGEGADLYTFTNPLYAAQHIYHLTIHYLIGKDAGPGGHIRTILKTHGQTHYGDYFLPSYGLIWMEKDYPLNPATGKEWTKHEVNSLQAGIAMDKEGGLGRFICDRTYIELHYL